ncbi:MAG: hypothetical protein P4M11_03610 [Candidatus Pacebacteria bacterium]|nr:hypothetical protein [Candidatus Paceibacterota bacterium]
MDRLYFWDRSYPIMRESSGMAMENFLERINYTTLNLYAVPLSTGTV